MPMLRTPLRRRLSTNHPYNRRLLSSKNVDKRVRQRRRSEEPQTLLHKLNEVSIQLDEGEALQHELPYILMKLSQAADVSIVERTYPSSQPRSKAPQDSLSSLHCVNRDPPSTVAERFASQSFDRTNEIEGNNARLDC